jgi:hypothetical protein
MVQARSEQPLALTPAALVVRLLRGYAPRNDDKSQ